MPTYNFLCEQCGYTDTLFLTILGRNIDHKCCKCGHLMTKLIGSGSGIIFKGKGWTRPKNYFDSAIERMDRQIDNLNNGEG